MQDDQRVSIPPAGAASDLASGLASNLPAHSFIADLNDIAILKVSGKDCADFLHAQLSSDVRGLPQGTHGLTSWCNPKGRMLMNGYLIREPDHFLLLLDSSLQESISKNLSRYILRSKVVIEVMNSSLGLLGVTCPNLEEARDILGPDLPEPASTLSHDGMTFCRVRDTAARYLALGPMAQVRSFRERRERHIHPAGKESWGLRDILNGLAWVDERNSGEFLPLDFNLDALGGVSFTKGCYPGQEIVTRIRHRGHIKKRLYLARAVGNPPPHPGEALAIAGDARHVGSIIAAAPWHGDTHAVLAVIECDQVPAATVLTAQGNCHLEYMPPPYAISMA